MVFKQPVLCGNCDKPIGFRLGSEPMGSVYCYSCEGFITHQQEMRERDEEIYRHALNR